MATLAGDYVIRQNAMAAGAHDAPQTHWPAWEDDAPPHTPHHSAPSMLRFSHLRRSANLRPVFLHPSIGNPMSTAVDNAVCESLPCDEV